MLYIPLASIPLLGPLGLPELLVIAGVIVLVFGATKLPKLGKGLGEGIRNFKQGLKGSDESADDTNKLEDSNSSDENSDNKKKK